MGLHFQTAVGLPAVGLMHLVGRAASASFTLGLTGDVNLNPQLRHGAAAAYVWGDTIHVTRSVGLMAIQHEGTLAEVNDSDPATIQFEDPLNYTATYAAAGIDFITVANDVRALADGCLATRQ